MKYHIYIKATKNTPDFKSQCEADSKRGAAVRFLGELDSITDDFWTIDTVVPFIASEDELVTN